VKDLGLLVEYLACALPAHITHARPDKYGLRRVSESRVQSSKCVPGRTANPELHPLEVGLYVPPRKYRPLTDDEHTTCVAEIAGL
jgi:hypothetical protein